jgi:hypothetical protein
MKLDLRLRCARCLLLIKGRMREASYARYRPYCTFDCQERANLERAQRYIDALRIVRQTKGEG